MIRTDQVSIFRRIQNSSAVQGIMAVVLLALLPFLLDTPYYIYVAVLVLLYVVLTLGLNIVVGLAGLLDLGYVAFYAVGAYLYAILSTQFGWPFWAVLPLGALLAAGFGVVLGFPTIRVRGDYLALVTLAFGEIIRLLLRNWDALTNGPRGIAQVAPPTLFSFVFDRPVHFYFLILIFAVLAFLLVRNLKDSSVGRNFRAIRDDEIAAEMVGVDTLRWKLWAFALGAALAGVAGVFFAAWQSFVAPESFSLLESVIVLCMVVMGGMGGLVGPAIAAVALVLLPELLRDFQEYRMLIFGLALIGIILIQERRGKRGKYTESTEVPESEIEGVPSSIGTSQQDSAADSEKSMGLQPLVSRLKVRELSKRFNGVQALDSVDFEISDGEILGLIGPNGAGKSTLFNCITMVEQPDTGSVDFQSGCNEASASKDGRTEGVLSLFGLKPHQVASSGMARTFQNVRLCASMTALENVVVGAQCRRGAIPFGDLRELWASIFKPPIARRLEADLWAFAMEMLKFVGLDRYARVKSSDMPLAYQKLVEIARAVAMRPRLLLLDEPAGGLNESEKGAFKDLIRRIRGDLGVTILLIEHDMNVIMEVCDRIFVLNYGRKIAEGSPKEIQNTQTVIEAYLGT